MASGGSGGSSSYNSRASCCLSPRLSSRRIRSMALRLAVVVSQAPGLGGMPSAGHRSTVVEDGGRAGRGEATSEDPATLRLEPVVEHVDRSLLVRGGEAGRVVDHGNQVLHLGSSPVVRGAPCGRPLTLLRTPLPPRHRL